MANRKHIINDKEKSLGSTKKKLIFKFNSRFFFLFFISGVNIFKEYKIHLTLFEEISFRLIEIDRMTEHNKKETIDRIQLG